MSEEINDFFGQILQEKKIDAAFTISDKITLSVENEFSTPIECTPEEQSRLDEEAHLRKKRRELIEKLSRCKNVKNPKFKQVNDKRALQRREIKKQIEECNLKLQDIDLERKK